MAFFRALPDHSLLDRLIRGRVWIPLLGVMLAGIVAMQVEVLKLGASIGRSIERGTALQTSNEALRANVALLGDDQRIMRLAAARGMVMPSPAGVGFLTAGSQNDVRRATAGIHTPDAGSFLALTTSNGAVVQPSSAAGPASTSQTDSSGQPPASTSQTDSSGQPLATSTQTNAALPPSNGAQSGSPSQSASSTAAGSIPAGAAPTQATASQTDLSANGGSSAPTGG